MKGKHNLSKPMGLYEIGLRGKFIAISVHIKKTEKAHISNLAAHLKVL